jgi:hypothetical protein
VTGDGKRPSKQRGASGPSALKPEVVRQNLAHREWFHVTREAGQLEINVNVARVPLPPRALVATRIAVERDASQVRMVFAQQGAPGSPLFTAAMTIQMSAKNVRRAFASPPFRESLTTYAEHEGITPEVRLPEPERYPRDRALADRATILAATFADDEAELRFFRVSPLDIHALQQGHTVELLYPVVQIIMHTAELMHLMHTVDSLLQDLPPETL